MPVRNRDSLPEDHPATAVESDDAFRLRLAQALYAMFELRTSQPWERVGEEGNYRDMHREWLEAADDLIERMSDADAGPHA